MATFSIDSLQFAGILVFLCTLLLYYYFYVFVPYKNLPSHRYELKILYWLLTRKPLNIIFFQDLTNVLKQHESDGICVIWLLKPYVFIFNEEKTKLLLNNPAAVDKPSEYKQVEFFLKDASFTSNGEKWRRIRKLMSTLFQMSVLRDNIDVYNRHSAKLVQQLNIVAPHEATKCLKKCFTHAFIEAIYGIRADSPENEFRFDFIVNAIEKVSKFVVQRLVSPWLYWDFTLHIFPSGRESLKLFKESYSISKKMLEEAKEAFVKSKYQESGILYEPKSVTEVLLEQHITKQSFSLEDVLNQINSLFIPNSEGISTSMTWCLFLLGLHPDIQEKAFEEVISATGDNVAYDDLRDLKYMECVIKESFRLYPTIPIIGRHLRKDMQCDKYKIPEGSKIFFVPYILHRNSNTFPDPEKYNPDRFMDPNSKINDCNFVPFAEGIRSCLGKNFTLMGMKVILCHVIRNFKIISLDRREDVVVTWGIILSSSKNLRIKFVPRRPPTSGKETSGNNDALGTVKI